MFILICSVLSLRFNEFTTLVNECFSIENENHLRNIGNIKNLFDFSSDRDTKILKILKIVQEYDQNKKDIKREINLIKNQEEKYLKASTELFDKFCSLYDGYFQEKLIPTDEIKKNFSDNINFINNYINNFKTYDDDFQKQNLIKLKKIREHNDTIIRNIKIQISLIKTTLTFLIDKNKHTIEMTSDEELKNKYKLYKEKINEILK